MRARMVSVASVAGPLRRAVRDIARASGKRVRWELDGEDTELDRHVLEQLREPLVALVRNATDHGVEPPEERAARGKAEEAVVRVEARRVGAEVVISVQRRRPRHRPGAGARERGPAPQRRGRAERHLRARPETAEVVSDVSGRGVGLDAVRSAVDGLRGRVEVSTPPGARHGVPHQRAHDARGPALHGRARGHRRYALPLHATAVALPAPTVPWPAWRAGRRCCSTGRRSASPSSRPCSARRDAGARARRRRARVAVVLTVASGRHAFAIDELVGERDVVVKELGRLAPPAAPRGRRQRRARRRRSCSCWTPTGSWRAARGRRPLAGVAGRRAAPPAARLLVVDDARTVRELQRSILERAGYDVVTAADGEAALRALGERPADLVLCDVEMPGMDGFAVCAAIRATPAIAATPVVILTSRDSAEDHRRGLEAGADAYMVKSGFDQRELLATVRRLLGEGSRPYGARPARAGRGLPHPACAPRPRAAGRRRHRGGGGGVRRRSCRTVGR